MLSQERVAEAEAVVRKAAKMNKIEAPHVIFEDYNYHVSLPSWHKVCLIDFVGCQKHSGKFIMDATKRINSVSNISYICKLNPVAPETVKTLPYEVG